MMADQNQSNDMRAVWQGQPASTQLHPDQIRRYVEEMEKKMKRTTYDLFAALTLTSLVVVGIAARFASPVLIAGAALSVCGFVYLTYEVLRYRAGAPNVADGAAPAVEYQRALIEHRLLFHRKGLWRRVFALLPGGILFFIGFAGAQPHLAPFIYFQLATFLIAVSLIVPMNKRAALKLERQLDDLYNLQ
jgi:hypothetical protein